MADSMPIPNVPLLRKAVEWAEAEAAKPDGTCLWDQSWYMTETTCGTAYCIAGYVVATQASFAPVTSFIATVDGIVAPYHDHGRRVLGITSDEALSLFDGTNSIATVRAVAEQIAARAGDKL